MHGHQYGKFEYGYWGLKCNTCCLFTYLIYVYIILFLGCFRLHTFQGIDFEFQLLQDTKGSASIQFDLPTKFTSLSAGQAFIHFTISKHTFKIQLLTNGVDLVIFISFVTSDQFLLNWSPSGQNY